jgi:hypothetical protein
LTFAFLLRKVGRFSAVSDKRPERKLGYRVPPCKGNTRE